MDTIKTILPQAQLHSKPLFESPEELYDARCETCGGYLSVTLAHLGGYVSKQPFAVCENEGCTGSYYVGRISDDLYEEFIAYILDREHANEAWVQRLTGQFEEANR